MDGTELGSSEGRMCTISRITFKQSCLGPALECPYERGADNGLVTNQTFCRLGSEVPCISSPYRQPFLHKNTTNLFPPILWNGSLFLNCPPYNCKILRPELNLHCCCRRRSGRPNRTAASSGSCGKNQIHYLDIFLGHFVKNWDCKHR